MAIKIIVDSASDILQEEAKAKGIICVPLSVSFGEEEFSDGVELTHREFYERLVESDTLPRTSQASPATFEKIYQEVTENGDAAVVITVSAKLSGTYQSAVIAAADYSGKIFVVDSESVCVGERILAERALKLCGEGLAAAEIARRLDEDKKHIRLLALLDTLEYLKKGGRISQAVAIAGSILSIKPVIAIENGEVALVGKARGSKNGGNLLRELVLKCGGINFDEPFCLAYTGLSDDLLQKYIADSADLWAGKSEHLPISTVGCVIGAHAGPGAIAVAFFENGSGEN